MKMMSAGLWAQASKAGGSHKAGLYGSHGGGASQTSCESFVGTRQCVKEVDINFEL